MFVLIWQDWTARVSGEGQRDLTCEGCGQRFAYGVTCTGVGVGRSYYFSAERRAKWEARRNAEYDLERQLAHAVVPMPCPGCGVYQRYMVQAMRQARYRCSIPMNRLTVWGYSLLTLIAAGMSIAAYATEGEPWALGSAVLLGIAWVLVTVICVPYAVIQHIRRMRFDPHAGRTTEQRMAYAQDRTQWPTLDPANAPKLQGEILVTDCRSLAPESDAD